jgi:hypothetical protein
MSTAAEYQVVRDEVREDVTNGFHAVLERYDGVKRKPVLQVLQELINKEVEREIIKNDQIKFVSITNPENSTYGSPPAACQTIWGESKWAGLGSDKPHWAREPLKKKTTWPQSS